MIPITEEDLDLSAETEILDVACDAFPLNGALVETFLDVGKVAKVHPVDEEVEGGGIWDGEEEDGVVWGAGHETRQTVSGDGRV